MVGVGFVVRRNRRGHILAGFVGKLLHVGVVVRNGKLSQKLELLVKLV